MTGYQQAENGGKSRHQGLVLAVLALAQLMIVLDGTIVNTALPTMQRELRFDTDQRQWVVVAYSLAFGSLLLLSGRLADLFGRKRAFVLGLAGFAISSAVAGASVNFAMLITGRAAQGAFGALLAPTALALLTSTFTTPKDRARAFGVFGAVAGAGGAIGLVLGGVLTEYASWRWCLFVNLLFAGLAAAGAIRFVHESSRLEPRPRLDLAGTALVTLGLTALVYGLSTAGISGWSDSVTLVTIAIGVVLLVGFVLLETRLAHPLLPLRVLVDRDRGGAYATTALVSLALFSVFLFLAYYLQTVRGYTPLQSGVAFLPLPASIAVTSIAVAPRLLQRFGPKPLLVAGPLIAAIGLLVINTIGRTSDYWTTIVPGLMILGLGLGNVFGSAQNLATQGLERADIGVGSAMVNTAQQVGGAVGTAVLSTIATSTATAYLQDHGTGRMAQVAAQLASYHAAYLTSAGILGLLALICAVVLRSARRRALPTLEPGATGPEGSRA